MAVSLEGRVAVVTGAGRGLGRAYALDLARLGASVVVNDLGGGLDGTGQDASPSEAVVEEIRSSGVTAIANADSIATYDGGFRLIEAAVEKFRRVDAVVHNAGILRDRAFQNINQEDWDAQAVNSELKHLGYQSTNITRDLDALMARTPKMVLQVRKEGTTRQARKRYKLTREGIKVVEKLVTSSATSV